MANLNTKHTPNEKVKTGRCAPKSIYGRKAFTLPDTKIVDDYPEIKRTYTITVTKNGKKTVVFTPPVKKSKRKKLGTAPHIMLKYKDSCRDEG